MKAEGIRAAVAGLDIGTPGDGIIRLAVSAGVSETGSRPWTASPSCGAPIARFIRPKTMAATWYVSMPERKGAIPPRLRRRRLRKCLRFPPRPILPLPDLTQRQFESLPAASLGETCPRRR
jgi:hypothetical protein